MTGALDGIRILDLSQWQQGPYATTLLSDLGAEVIKVERPEYGDAGRHALRGLRDDEIAADFFAHNRGKRGMTVQLSHPRGRELILELAGTMDVCVHNFRTGTMEGWGLGYEDLRERNPAIIYAAATGSGPKGAHRERPMFDIVAQAMGGIMSINGEEGGFPSPVGSFMADQVGAMTLAMGILGALVHRERTGEGQSVDVSLLGSQVALQSFEITHYLFTKQLPRRAGRGHPHTPWLWYTFPAQDGYFVMAGVREDRWPEFCRVIGDASLIDDQRFDCYDARAANRDALVERLDELFRERPVAHWVAALGEIDVSCGPVQSYADVAEDPQVLANEYIAEMDHPQAGRVRYVNTPIQFGRTPVRSQGPPPELGQHTEEILLEMGYDWPAIVELREAGAI